MTTTSQSVSTATTTRQTTIFGVEDWKRIYQAYREADFQSYDFETLRKSFVDYLRLYYPETFNDYIESSEFIALLDVIAFMGQSLAFRTDLNTRENYIDTAERRDSVVKLANLVSYTPKRNTCASGYIKVLSVKTTENVIDYNGVNLSNVTINWADPSNFDWLEQFSTILNASLVNTQRIGNPANNQVILGVDTQEYTINLVPGYIPVIPYTATVAGISMPFEVVNATSKGQNHVYEPPPLPVGQFNVLFRNDQLGYASANTGFFFLFKQGSLQNQDFNLPEQINNRTVDINIEGVNNTDYWLYQLDNTGAVNTIWTYVESVFGAAIEQLAPGTRNIYSITSRVNDQITLDFGDGVFATIPVGQFRNYVRASNGLTYVINPEDMQSISIPISYVSRTGTLETITFTCGLTQPVSNAQARESITDIKLNAPSRYYTQNRMVNGEDYNNFPYTQYTSILKSKALNRASIGTSRYLDLVDATGKYSSTNIYGSDGALYKNTDMPAFTFTWVTNNEVTDAVQNKIQPTVLKDGARQFYYANYPRPDLAGLSITWHQSTTITGETTGYFVNYLGNPVPISTYASNNAKYIEVGSLVKFVPPTGYYFNAENHLVAGVPQGGNDSLVIWASPTAIYVDGTNQGLGNFNTGVGPVVFNVFVPTGAIATQVIPLFVTNFSTTLQQQIAEQIILNQNFGIGYDSTGSITGNPYTWYLITSNNLDNNADFSLANAGNTDGTHSDSSWFIQCTTDGYQYTTITRSLNYLFGSVAETRFFFYGNQRIYDSRTGTVIKDFVNILKTNSQPDNNYPLLGDVVVNIIDQPVLSDGYVDDFQVVVGFKDTNDNGVPLNPDFFNEVVAPDVDPNSKLVFFQATVDFDNLERYLLVNKGVVDSDWPTLQSIQLVQSQYAVGQVFYAYQEQRFYKIAVSSLNTTSVVPETGFIAQVGRQDLYFQYRHNSPLTNRIDPSSTNIIDMYICTLDYYTSYTNWIQDTTGTVAQPTPPTIDDLSTAYQNLQNYKMISDNMIFNSVSFQPLFGDKADENLRATIKVIPTAGTTASNSEIINLVLTTMNSYFDIANWDFGQTFYFSELAGYIHSRIGNIVSSVVLVPLNPQKSFGDLYEIRSAPNQIFVNGATVQNIEVITALTSTNLQTAPGSGVI